jgi:hypothetical protein
LQSLFVEEADMFKRPPSDRCAVAVGEIVDDDRRDSPEVERLADVTSDVSSAPCNDHLHD